MEPEHKPTNPAIETYAGDIAEALRGNREGLVKKIIRGEEEREQDTKAVSPASRQNKLFVVASVALVLLGVGLLGYFLTRGENTVEPDQQFTTLIFTDASAFVGIDGLKRAEIEASIVNRSDASDLKPGGVRSISLTRGREIVGLREFVSVLGENFTPGDPAFVSDAFLLGSVNTAGFPGAVRDSGFFMLLKARSNADIFPPLRAWEDKMLSDLRGLFNIKIGADNNYLLTKRFEDGIIENKNARILRDDQGNLVLAYVFADNTSVVITGSAPAAREILLRLASKQTKE